ncbi:unnamed protein product [Amaranthus hypochondriacus]
MNNKESKLRKGYVPLLVGKYEEEKERFMVPLKFMNHPSLIALLQLSSNEFGYHLQGVIPIPCQPHQFRLLIEKISCSTNI